MKRRTKTTVDPSRLMVIDGLKNPVRWCTACGETVRVVEVDEAALTLFGLRTLHRLIEAGELHRTELSPGRLLICLNSLTRNLKTNGASTQPRR
ncbi:MAG: hypothetical protein H0W76_27470 [Pyrinomonadaceae bacterium]|nr:hypothetical protein [Pyrinomonadaceae bacterium]